MRSVVLLCAACICSVVCAARAFAGGYVVMTAGPEGDSDAASVGGEGGWRGDTLLLGAGVGVIFTGTGWKNVHANPILSYDEKRNHDLEGYGACGWAIGRRWRLVGTAGASFASRSGRTSTPQGTSVVWEPEYETGRLTFSGQVQYEAPPPVAGAGIHDRRGVLMRIGFCW